MLFIGVLAQGGMGGLACISDHDQTVPANAIRLGTVLPFSGERAASGVPLERALRLAVEVVNAANALGRPLYLDVRDSHSDDVRGTASALDLINNNPIPFFVGPEEPKITYQLTNAIKLNRMVNLLPGLTSPTYHDPSTEAGWFRLAPSPNYLACALAKRMLKDGIRTANTVSDPDDYSGTFATMFGRVFTFMGGTLLPGLQLSLQSSSFESVFATNERFSPDATLLITSPSVASPFLQEWAVRGKIGKWYLGPTLKNPELVRNVPRGVLEGFSGISPDLGPNADNFATYFEAKTAVPPLDASNYYYDAVALLALAIAEGLAQEGSVPTPATLKVHLQNVTSASGQEVYFDQLEIGLALIAAKQKIHYSGAAGSYVLSTQGDSIGNSAAVWQIKADVFQTVGFEQCSDAEVYSTY
jgi:ABC-type branched-subunit amino acid transport system substrate-binding protein